MVPICRLVFLVTLSLSLSLPLPISVFCLQQCNFPAIFNFGDSNSDTGGLAAMYGENAARSPNGETYFHYPTGRLSDGRLMIDFMAEDLGIPYLSSNLDSIGANFSHGANYATSGSTIRRQNTTIYQSGYSPLSLDNQYDEFSYFIKRSKLVRQRGDIFKNLLPEESKFSSTLYTFDIGQNDLTAGFDVHMSIEQVKAYVPDLISQFISIIKKVYASGGRSFWIHNTGPVGCLPSLLDTQMVTEEQMDKYGCAFQFNDVSEYYNEKLKEAVMKLRSELTLAAITYVDIYSAKYLLITQSQSLGFGDPFWTCCGTGGKYNFNSGMWCGTGGKSCEDPSSRIIWDGTHYTEAANKWIYGQIANGAFSDPPVSLKMACYTGNLTHSYLSNDL